jgi:hypothetical protein
LKKEDDSDSDSDSDDDEVTDFFSNESP